MLGNLFDGKSLHSGREAERESIAGFTYRLDRLKSRASKVRGSPAKDLPIGSIG